MSIGATLLIIAVAAAIALLVGFSFGHGIGRTTGYDEGWNAKYFADAEKDKARRDAKGQFKAKEARTV